MPAVGQNVTSGSGPASAGSALMPPATAAAMDVTPLITHRYLKNEVADAIAVAADRGSGKVSIRLFCG
jgi:hypothetical protein